MSYDKKRLTSDLKDTAVQLYRKGEKITAVGIIIGLTTGKQYIMVQPLQSGERYTAYPVILVGRDSHRPYYRQAIHHGTIPMVRREIHSIPSHTSGQSGPSNPKV